MVWVIDNYDSFVFNLVHYIRMLGVEVVVLRNDDEILRRPFPPEVRALVISPGPCTPSESGHTVEVIRREGIGLPMLGVCLGHQCLGAAFGIPVLLAPEPVHGMASPVHHKGHPLFAGLNNPFFAGRYHSLILPDDALSMGPFDRLAWTEDGINMAISHREYPLFGVQFHPESILTPDGFRIVANFLHLAGIQTFPFQNALK